MKPELIIHIGSPKTGSSAIQRFCLNNREALSKHGFFYPKHDFDSNQVTSGHASLAHFIAQEKEAAARSIFKEYRDQANQHKKTLLLSSEVFFRYPEFTKKITGDTSVRLIAFVRHPIDLTISLHNQAIKRHFGIHTLIEHCSKVASRTNTQYAATILHRWADLFDDEYCQFIPYRNNIDGDMSLENNFLLHLGILENNLPDFQPNENLINRSYVPEALEIKRLFNSILDKNDKKSSHKIDLFLQKYSDKQPINHTSTLESIPPILLQQLDTIYAESLNQLIERFPTLNHLASASSKHSFKLKKDPNRTQKIIDLLKQILKKYPSLENTIQNRIEYSLLTGNYNSAITKMAELLGYDVAGAMDLETILPEERLNRLLQEDSKAEDYLRELALMFEIAGKLDTASKCLEKSLTLSRNKKFLEKTHERLNKKIKEKQAIKEKLKIKNEFSSKESAEKIASDSRDIVTPQRSASPKNHYFDALLLTSARFIGLVWQPRHRLMPASTADNQTKGWELLAWSPVLPGWYMIEINCSDKNGDVSVQYVLEANGQRKNHLLPLNPDRVSKRLIYLPIGFKRLSVHTLPGAEALEITHHRLNWMCPRQAHDRIAKRLAQIHPGYRDSDHLQVLDKLRYIAKQKQHNWQELAFEQYEATFFKLCSQEHYDKWITQIEQTRLADSETPDQSAQPDISVGLLLRGTTNQTALAETLNSLTHQQGITWKVIIILENQNDLTSIHQQLSDLQQFTWTILTNPDSDGHITVATWQSAMQQIEADYWMSSCAGDLFAKASSRLLARHIHRNPQAEMIYSDEDELDDQNQRRQPRFKPAWNPDLLLSMPYIGRMAIYRRDVLTELLHIAADTTHSAHGQELEYIFTLGLRERFIKQPLANTLKHGMQEPRVKRIPHPLYHWHNHNGVVFNPAKHVNRHLQRTGESYQEVVPGKLPGTSRIFWTLPNPLPKVSLIIPTRDRVDILRPCVDAILQNTDYSQLEVLVIDNQSRCPETLAYLQTLPKRDTRARVLNWDKPFNYSAINNFGVKAAKGSIIGLVNNDIDPINPGWLHEMVTQALRPGIGCVGAKLYYANDKIQHAGVILGIGGVAGHSHRLYDREDAGYMQRLLVVQNLSAVTAACLVMQKSIFEKVNGFNEDKLKVALNDVDLCLKVREAGYRNLWTPYAELYHYESISRGADDTRQKRQRAQTEVEYMRQRWGKALRNDPAYNPNLSLVHEDFSLR